MFGRSSVALAVVDSRTLEIVFSNDAFLRFFKDLQVASGRDALAGFSPLAEALGASLKSESVVVHEWAYADARLEFSAIDDAAASGGSTLVQCIALPRVSPGADLTVSAASGHAVVDVNESYRRILDHFPFNVWLCTVKGEVFWTNRTSNLFTYGEAEVYDPGNTRYISKVHPEDLTAAGVALAKAMACGRMETPQRYRLRDHQGVYHWFEFTMSPVLDADGEPGYWVGTSVNIQALHEAEVLAQARIERLQARVDANESRLQESQRLVVQQHKMELVAHLAGGVAHDLNNLLHVMGISIELMQSHAQQEALRPHLRVLERCIEKAGRLSTQLAGFSGRLPQNASAQQPRQMVGDIRELLVNAVGAEVDLDLVIGDGLHPVFVDKSYLENALINLAINARDAMNGRGTVRLRVANSVSVHGDGSQCEYVMFRIEDEGAGIPDTLRERVFDPFFTTKPLGKGSGLGLTMVRTFVESSGGYIEIESTHGQGTQVAFYLPRSEHIAELAGDGDAPLQKGAGCILLVEDDESVRESMSNILTELGYDTIPSFSVDHAVKLLEGGMRPDLVVSDIRMPGKLTINDLIAVVEQMLQVPIIFATGYSADVVVTEGLIQDKYPVLFKPFSVAEISARIRRALAVATSSDGPMAA